MTDISGDSYGDDPAESGATAEKSSKPMNTETNTIEKSPSATGTTARMSEWIRRNGIGDEFIDQSDHDHDHDGEGGLEAYLKERAERTGSETV